jgi:hypothetical protein
MEIVREKREEPPIWRWSLPPGVADSGVQI